MSLWRRELLERLSSLGLKPDHEAEIVEELAQHLEDRVRDLVASGCEPATARTAALEDLDAPGELARRLADIVPRPLTLPPPGAPARGRWLQARSQDVRHSLRSLRRSPAFTATVIATLGLTIGPTTALLSIGNWLIWRPTPGVVEPNRLAMMYVAEWVDRGFSPRGVSYLNLADLRRTSKTVTAITGFQEGTGSLGVAGVSPLVVQTGWVTWDFFDVLGARVVAGRTFRTDDDQPPAGAQVTVISDGLARRAFGGPAAAIGGRLMLNGRPLIIIGVLPPAFVGTEPFSHVDVWYPGATYGYVNHFGRPRWTTRDDGLFYSFIVRLAPDATFAMAQAELDTLVRGLVTTYPEDNRELESVRARLVAGLGTPILQREGYQRLVSVLLAVGGALLLLGCANVANLLMVRSIGRRREHAVRRALGASPVRLFLLQLTEALLLAAGGAALGVALAVWLKQFVATLLFPPLSTRSDFNVPLDLRVLAMALAVSIGCGLAAGFVPAVYGAWSKSEGAGGDAGGRSVTSTRWVRGGFAVAQLALSLALVTSALMLVATLRNLNAIDLGFTAAGVTVHGMGASGHGYPPDRASVYYKTIMERLQGVPEFEAVSIGARAPFGSGRIIRLPDPAGGGHAPIEVYANAVSHAYFDVLGIRIVHGRAFTDAEAFAADSGSPVAIITEKLARRLFHDADPIGQRIVLPARTRARPARELTVVGVTPDVHWHEVSGDADLFLYLPFNSPDFGSRDGTLLVKSPLTLNEVVRRVEAVAKDVDATLPLQYSRTLRTNIDTRLRDRRVFAWVLSMLGWLAVVLAAVGLYGLLAQSVAERTREFGIRMAIGSGRAHIFRLVIRQALWIGALGTALGIGLAFAGTRLVEAQLYGVTRVDPSVYVAAALSLAGVVLVAGLWPARSATRIEPVEALRNE
jgi:predicted permease